MLVVFLQKTMKTTGIICVLKCTRLVQLINPICCHQLSMVPVHRQASASELTAKSHYTFATLPYFPPRYAFVSFGRGGF